MALTNTDPYAGDGASFPETITLPTDNTEKTAESVAVPLAELADRTMALVPKVTIIDENTVLKTWTKNPGAVFVEFTVVGRGGDGGDSVSGTSGAGGGSAAVLKASFPASLVPDVLYCKYSSSVFVKDVNDNDPDNGNGFCLRSFNGQSGVGSTPGEGGDSLYSDVAHDGTGIRMLTGYPGTIGGVGASGGGTGAGGGDGYGAVAQSDEVAAGAAGLGGRGYGAGGGGAGTTSGGAAGGGSGSAGYGFTKFAADGATGTGSRTGGAGASGVVIIVEWCGVEV